MRMEGGEEWRRVGMKLWSAERIQDTLLYG